VETSHNYGAVNGLYVKTGKQFNEKPTYQKRNPDGDFTDRYLYLLDDWAIGSIVGGGYYVLFETSETCPEFVDDISCLDPSSGNRIKKN
jgi:hypothetical protein